MMAFITKRRKAICGRAARLAECFRPSSTLHSSQSLGDWKRRLDRCRSWWIDQSGKTHEPPPPALLPVNTCGGSVRLLVDMAQEQRCGARRIRD